MELRGHRRAKKPQSGFFRRHYSTTTAAPVEGKSPHFPLAKDAFSCYNSYLCELYDNAY